MCTVVKMESKDCEETATFKSLVIENIEGVVHGNWTFRSQDHSLPGAKVPGVELSLPGTFVP